ncbi:fumble-domain-containing protein [Polychytrium aggregatum]|uniref:fumble-domain-containing protein n=1 Tax=Polychytrium aggregatum TaxID=110093 RepID=UPI0022FE20B2|nr:fumble-domain-containing protein [Polychytrium aggregatum]KAI9207464.1 fumble-domain-containing protein [Polychytrium aggregatum]
MRGHNLNVQGVIICDEETEVSETRDIVFPHQSEDVSQIAVDIGGSLAKVVWFSKKSDSPGGRLNFVKFETQHIDQCVDFIHDVLYNTYAGQVPVSQRVIKATGGGAHKYYDLFQKRLGVTIQREDEMECLITGLNFLVRQVPYEVFTYDERRPQPMVFETNMGSLFPYLLVNIGSGVSIIKVTSDETFERVSGTCIGGGTLWGLLSLMTNAQTYDEMLELSKSGDNRNVDMLVGDIYGGAYNNIGLKSTTIASSFGKVFKAPPEERKSKFRHEDISRSLLYLVSNNIGQIAYLNAQAHGIQRIYFSGFFIRGHPITMNTLSYAINFWSKGKIKALFLRHEGYLGAVGAFLRHMPGRQARLGSFTENFSHVEQPTQAALAAVGTLDSYPTGLTAFPALEDINTYQPDTVTLNDLESQQYWITLLDRNLADLVELVIEWDNVGKEDAKERASKFEKMYREHLERLTKEPNSYGVLTIRSLLQLREQCLREMGFYDVFAGVKRVENATALRALPDLLKELDSLGDETLLLSLVHNVIAGNMYDWGAKSVHGMLKRGELDFQTAKSKVKYNDKFFQFNALKDQLLQQPYKKAIVFVDNSGADIILGMIPFARFLLSKGTSVILAANTLPAVNDITSNELRDIIEAVASFDRIISEAWNNEALLVVGNGNGSPCLDLGHINEKLAVEAAGCDLVVLEGMGRAIHTNYHAKFKVDSLKIGVFKNPFIAEHLGASMYDALCVFTPAA